MFDQMYDCVKLHNTACMMACRPVVIHCRPNVNYFRTVQAINKINGSTKSERYKAKIDIPDSGFVDISKVGCTL
jgi:hypothetical protein